MKIYFCHSNNFDYQKELYQPIKDSEIFALHELIFPHEDDDRVTNSKEIIKSCDLVVAEVSYPSTGMGIELGWADSFSIPILCISKTGLAVSSSIKEVANNFLTYEDGVDLVRQLICNI